MVNDLANTSDACALCGKDPATGFATINDERYCHGDYEPDPTCYMKSQWLLSPGAFCQGVGHILPGIPGLHWPKEHR